MNTTLDAAWKSARPPFHDKTIVVAEHVPVKVMARALQSIARHIELVFPHSELRLAHDGMPTTATKSKGTKSR